MTFDGCGENNNAQTGTELTGCVRVYKQQIRDPFVSNTPCGDILMFTGEASLKNFHFTKYARTVISCDLQKNKIHKLIQTLIDDCIIYCVMTLLSFHFNNLLFSNNIICTYFISFTILKNILAPSPDIVYTVCEVVYFMTS